jgi:hypothetical protein
MPTVYVPPPVHVTETVAVPEVAAVVAPVIATSPKASGVLLIVHTVVTFALTAKLLVAVAAQQVWDTKAPTMAATERITRYICSALTAKYYIHQVASSSKIYQIKYAISKTRFVYPDFLQGTINVADLTTH